MISGVGEKLKVEPKFENYPKSEHERNMGLFRARFLFVTQALRYKNRASTICLCLKTVWVYRNSRGS